MTGTNNGIKYQLNSEISITATMFITKPVLTICDNFTCPLANTIAFGGVPMGIILAQLAPRVIAALKTAKIRGHKVTVQSKPSR